MVTHATPPRDPRSIITPDAFEVAPELLGIPLAPPSKRLAAILIDLAVIGVLTALTRSFALVLGLVVAVLFIRQGFKHTPVQGSVFGRAMRFSVGCLGVWIGAITAIVWVATGIGGRLGGDGERDAPVSVDLVAGGSTLPAMEGLRALAQGMGEARRLSESRTADSALAAATDLARVSFGAGLPEDDVRALFVEFAPEDAPWTPSADSLFELAISAARPDAADPGAAAALPDDSALAGPLSDPLVADTLRSLQHRLAREAATAEARQRSIEELRRDLEEAEGGGSLFSLLRNFVDELGFGFGWASLYLTVMLSWWKGQTLGKRIMKIRVRRLDGHPITWWTAFERAGGYAAGFATGLLGFAQVYWDSNRQAIHDRIAGTVVVLDGAEKVVDWKSAL